MLSPKRQKYRKHQRGRQTGISYRGCNVEFGEFGLQATDCGVLDGRQIEAGRICISRYTKRKGQLWIRVFPHKTYTSKPIETRMGKGKGAPEKYITNVKPGRIIYEIGGVTREQAEEALRVAGYKLPIKTKMVCRNDTIWG